MNGKFAGLRQAGGTHITRCCGCEALIPASPDEDSIFPTSETDDGTPITEEEFPDAELVCGSCGKTWPRECAHDEVVAELGQPRVTIEDQQLDVVGLCLECGERVWMGLSVANMEEIE